MDTDVAALRGGGASEALSQGRGNEGSPISKIAQSWPDEAPARGGSCARAGTGYVSEARMILGSPHLSTPPSSLKAERQGDRPPKVPHRSVSLAGPSMMPASTDDGREESDGDEDIAADQGYSSRWRSSAASPQGGALAPGSVYPEPSGPAQRIPADPRLDRRGGSYMMGGGIYSRTEDVSSSRIGDTLPPEVSLEVEAVRRTLGRLAVQYNELQRELFTSLAL